MNRQGLWKMQCRPSRTDDSPFLQQIELAANEQFRAIGLDEVANANPDPVEELDAYAQAGRSWVVSGNDDTPIGYILVDQVDGSAHIAQVTVLPEFQRRGVGQCLINRVMEWAQALRMKEVTLTTYSEVPWNRPLYEHLGFVVLDEIQIGPELRAIQRDEAAKGFGPDGRVAMRKHLDA